MALGVGNSQKIVCTEKILGPVSLSPVTEVGLFLCDFQLGQWKTSGMLFNTLRSINVHFPLLHSP